MAKTKVMMEEGGDFDRNKFVRDASIGIMSGLVASMDPWCMSLSRERKAEEAVAMARMLLKELDK